MPSFLDSIKDSVESAKNKATKALGFDLTESGEKNKGWPLDKKVEKVDPQSAGDPVGMYFTSSWLAHTVFGQVETDFIGNSPYLGFQYFVKINFNGELDSYVKGFTGGDKKPAVDFAPIIQSVDLPSMSVSTDKLNEYNRWRISQTKVEYEPVKMSIFDSVNGLGFSLWEMYYQYYFRDGLEDDSKAQIPLTPDAFTQSSADFGYNIQQVEDFRYLIKSIDIFQLHQASVRHIRLHNPRISDFTHASLAYEDSGAIKLDFTFDYEYVSYLGYYDISEFPDLETYFKFSNVPDGKRPFGNNPYPKQTLKTTEAEAETPEEQSLLDQIMDVKNPAEALAALKRAKAESQEVLAAGAQAGAMFNQVQMDITGKDTPIIEAPSVRPFSAVVNTVPTGYSDIRRSARKVRGDKT